MAFPDTILPVIVEAEVDGAWVDITRLDADTHVLGLTGQDGITISETAANERSEVAASTIVFEYLDNNATLDHENFRGVYFRKIVPGTRFRVKADGSTRGVGELTSVAPIWEDGSERVVSTVIASGIFRRIGEMDQPLRDPINRAVTGAGTPLAYWPLTDGSDATKAASALPGARAMTFIGSPSMGSVTGPDGNTDPSIELASGDAYTGGLTATVAGTGVSGWAVDVWVRAVVTTTGLVAANAALLQWQTGGSPGSRWELHASQSSMDGDQAIVLRSLPNGAGYNHVGPGVLGDTWHHVRVTASQDNPTTATVTLYWDGVAVDFATITATIGSLANCTFTVGDYAGELTPTVIGVSDSMEGFSSVSLNSLIAWDTPTPPLALADAVDAGTGWTGETAAARMDRLCTEEGVTFTLVGRTAQTKTVGPQRSGMLLDLLRDAAIVDGGILHQTVTTNGVKYRTLRDLYNQPGIELAYSTHISAPYHPVLPDQIRNDQTVKRSNGATARYLIPDDDWFHFSTQSPPDGAGPRPESPIDLRSDNDEALIGMAAWRAHLASWREKRVVTVTLDLERAGFTDAVRTLVRNALMGDVLEIDTTGTPPHIPVTPQRLMIRGRTEIVAQKRDRFIFNTVPADMFEVDVMDGESTLAVGVDDNDTSALIATSRGRGWSTTDEPYYIQLAGQPATVTTMVTGTPVFVSAGTVSHADNADTTPGQPAGLTAGDLKLLVAAHRNLAGTVNVPTGWTTLIEYGNVHIMRRYHETGQTAPTVTYSGGSAGDTTSAQIVAFSGLSHCLVSSTETTDSGAKWTPGAATQQNASADPIAYPAATVPRDDGVRFIVFWKQAGHTGVSLESGFDAEAFDSFTTTIGSGQSFGMQYDIYTTATDITADSITASGGVSAISKAICFALRPIQTATLTRGIAGTAASVAAEAAVHVWRPGVNAL